MSTHPNNMLLQAYASGEIDAVSGLVVAMHLEVCPDCRDLVAQFEGEQAQHFAAGKQDEMSALSLFDAMFDAIVQSDVKEDAREVYEPRYIEVKGKRFVLPQTLCRYADLMSEWRSYGGKVFSSQLDFGEEARVNLMYISEGVQIPQHTHKGLETTLVLHGSFSDEDGEYQQGDFMQRDASVKHSPKTKAGEDCLCLTVLTDPLIFTQGVARVFNLFGKGLYP
ncbi:ChrR family anti-sigma-E factor [Vibrio vulnificus]|uniref:ChrR family anti-sigma-E factor n=1 Tax=Vibrio vulnificus TaxID=672 RepID=UPI00076B34DE|nr:ChrR family anti-sigma-E factor [Vibrio vulnificus]OJI59802.1 Anti-sigma-E factor ChrR [Vibrio fluvialis]AMG12911.1 transcriptional regulator [Vibrio vulnificus]EGR0235075.1 transcriptional regulator [Vibrio vulnificus]EGR1866579.1 transcriptional regulator [Vibrio vulnificus]EGR7952425.1 transcriptional regulator [Vibrio vulnificus]